ncbi:MAG: LacI family DNA-binding transcriptional regulator [bacterium]|nr:LacI family DNA-binding transcriptional regulator [bacterium]
MRIKAKEIAQNLGLSQATVSLALNDRPGVNEKTKKRVLEYVEQQERELWLEQMHKRESPNGTVLVLNYVKNGVIMGQIEQYRKQFPDGRTPLMQKMAETVGESGYRFQYRIFHEQTQKLETLLGECRQLDVRGIYIMAAEMCPGDMYPFLQLKVPIVAGDNLFEEGDIDSYLIDNKEGISRGVRYLVDKGHSHIVYLAENISIFNFEERREAFLSEMAKRELGDASNRIWYLGSNVEEVYTAMLSCLDKRMKGTTAFVLESSVVSLGVCKALMERQVRIPRDISLIGFDTLPMHSLLGLELTLIKGTHTKRHLAAVKHLVRRMENENEEIMKVYYRTRMIEGNSVFDKKKYIYQ